MLFRLTRVLFKRFVCQSFYVINPGILVAGLTKILTTVEVAKYSAI